MHSSDRINRQWGAVPCQAPTETRGFPYIVLDRSLPVKSLVLQYDMVCSLHNWDQSTDAIDAADFQAPLSTFVSDLLGESLG